jgi:diaminopimelate decarboxylase
MDCFHFASGELHAERVALEKIAAAVGTPAYVYSRRGIVDQFEHVQRAFARVDPLVCYAVKANSNLAVLELLARLGAGFDVVSEGELERVRRAGGDMARCVFAGVGKTDDEIAAAIRAKVALINAEGVEELERIGEIARSLGVRPAVALRVNPDVDAHTHSYITTGRKENKFGIGLGVARKVLRERDRHAAVDLAGLHMHLGSQITETRPYLEAATRLLELIDELRGEGIDLRMVDIGGGFGIRYHDDVPAPRDLAPALVPLLERMRCRVILEPGRFIAGNSGVLLVRVTFVKRTGAKTFVITDGGMNDLLRPTLYGAYHEIVPVKQSLPNARREIVDVVGPVCESGDFFAQDRAMPVVGRGDLLAILGAGAYGFTMASNYNTRLRAPEVLVDGSEFRVVRRRETLDDLLAPEIG